MLDYGRVTFGATCTGHAKACLKAMIEHAKKRVQFQQPLAEFELVQKKIAFAAAHCLRDGGGDRRVRRVHRPAARRTTCSKRRS